MTVNEHNWPMCEDKVINRLFEAGLIFKTEGNAIAARDAMTAPFRKYIKGE